MTNNRPDTRFTGPELCQLSAREVVGLLRRKEISPIDLLEASEQRVEQVNGDVNAIVTECFARARAQLETDLPTYEAQHGSHHAWLGGLPVGIKDLTDVEGVRTTYGTKGLADNVPEEDDPVVELLEKRGALVVGKTNTPEMGAGGNTFNDVFGYTRNPWDTRKNAGGSSGGAAVSLATGEVWLSEGSDLAGSLRTPASYNGVVGFRTTPGRAFGGPMNYGFSGEGISGPMARDVADCALFLDAMCGYDERSPMSLPEPYEPFQKAVEKATPKVRLAYSPTLNGLAPVESEIDQIMRAALDQVSASGGVVEEACPELPGLYETYITLRATFWAALPGRAPEHIQRHFKKTLHGNIDVGRNLTIDQVIDANLARTELYHRMRVFLHDYDVLACPVVGLEPLEVEIEYPPEVDGQPTADYIDWLRFSFLATATGLPAIVVPCGFTRSGMPVGIQLIGPPRGDAKVLATARAVEMAVDLDASPIDPFVRHG